MSGNNLLSSIFHASVSIAFLSLMDLTLQRLRWAWHRFLSFSCTASASHSSPQLSGCCDDVTETKSRQQAERQELTCSSSIHGDVRSSYCHLRHIVSDECPDRTRHVMGGGDADTNPHRSELSGQKCRSLKDEGVVTEMFLWEELKVLDYGRKMVWDLIDYGR